MEFKKNPTSGDCVGVVQEEKIEETKTGSERKVTTRKKPTSEIPRKEKNKGKTRKGQTTLRKGIDEVHDPLKGYVKI